MGNSTRVTQEHHSIGQLYRGGNNSPTDLELQIYRRGDDSLELHLINKRYGEERWQKLKHLAILLGSYSIYWAVAASSPNTFLQRRIIIDLLFFLWLAIVLYSTFGLVKSEKVLFFLDLAIQYQTQRFLNREKSLFVSLSHVHDIVLNEVIENLDVHYLLIMRTKAPLYSNKPIIPLFNMLRPSVKCLEVIYKELNNKIA